MSTSRDELLNRPESSLPIGGERPPIAAALGVLGGRTTDRIPSWLVVYGLPALLYAAVAALAYWPTNFIDSTRLTYTGDDVAEGIWGLAWFVHALFHGHDPFVSYAINYPYGANMASNTMAPALGLLASPLIVTIGAIATFNLLMRVAFLCSALAMYLVLRRWVSSRFACFVGGLLYGFSPFMIGQGHDHIGLIFVPFPPLILAVLDELIVRHHWSARRCGLWLGLLAAIELLISAEVLAQVALLAVVGIAYLAIRHHSLVASRIRRVAAGLGYALGPFIVLGAWQTYELLFGPERVTGAPAPYELAQFREDLLAPILPTMNEAFGPSSWISHSMTFTSGDFVENGGYLGIPLILLLVALAIYARHRAGLGFAVVMAAVAFILCLGSPLNIDGHVTSIPLPFALFPKLPLFQDESASRYSLFLDLFVAIVLAIGVDEAIRRAVRTTRRWALTVKGLGVVGVLVVGLFPLVPRFPYPTYLTYDSASLPPYFASSLSDAIPKGAVVLTYPLPVWPYTDPLLWQVTTGMRFTEVSGPWNEPQDLLGVGEGTPPLLDPPIVQALFTQALYGEPASVVYGEAIASYQLPQRGLAASSGIREFLSRYKVDDIVISSTGDNPGLVIDYLTDALGRSPVYEGGVEVFYNVQSDL